MMTDTGLFINALSACRESIEALLRDGSFDALLRDAAEVPFMGQYTDAFHTFSEGGKRIRAFMVTLGYRLCGKDCDDDILRAALSYEIFQSGILIHDDIIDESDLRRSRPSMHIALGGGQTGIAKAICVGDMGITTAADAIFSTAYDADKKVKAVANQNKVFRLTIAGELKDIELSEEEDHSFDDVIKMYELKTSWYTFTGPLQLGMILGGGDEELLKKAEELGRLMGIAFQIRDDILGIYGSSSDTGKNSLSDMEEGKKTVLTAYFRDKATEAQKSEFSGIYGKGSYTDPFADRIRELLDESGAHAAAEELCKSFNAKALELIGEMKVPEDTRAVFRGMLSYMNERKG